MPTIETITLQAGQQRLHLIVSDDEAYPDKNISGTQITAYDDDVLYSQSTGTAERPAVVVRKPLVAFTVEVSGIPSEVASTALRLTTDPSKNFYYQSTTSQAGDDGVVVFTMQEVSTPSSNNSWVLQGKTQFSLYTMENPEQPLLYQDQPASVPMELYALGYDLPNYFSAGVPLLLLRMFVGAATNLQVSTAEDWIALVVKICHGSAHPLTGGAAETENHWLKYNSYGGAPSFVTENLDGSNPIPVLYQFNNYGGFFQLSAWLDAFRNFKEQEDSLTLVNCYDQAGAVEVAASLGINYNHIAWEFHQTHGYISTDAELVGWGPCNHPYFDRDPKLKVLGETDPKRKPFTNHAFLSWSPNFNPTIQFYKVKTDPSAFTDCTMFAIDACAGPHLGNEPRGVWVDPLSYPNPSTYPDGYTAKKTTYWRTRDDQYPTNAESKLKGRDQHHFWTPGITGLSDDDAKEDYEPLHENPLDGSGIRFPAATSFPNPDQVLGGRISQFQDAFKQSLASVVPGSDTWKPVPIADITLKKAGVSNGVLREIKLYDPKEPALSFASLKISVLHTLSDALAAQEARTKHVVITSVLEGCDWNTLSPQNVWRTVHIIQSDFTNLLLIQNLMVEVTGHFGKDALETLTQDVASVIDNAPNVDGSQWEAILN